MEGVQDLSHIGIISEEGSEMSIDEGNRKVLAEEGYSANDGNRKT